MAVDYLVQSEWSSIFQLVTYLAQGLLNFLTMDQIQILGKSAGPDPFDYPTPEELICLWRSFRGSGLRVEEAWDAVAAGIALDMAFSRRVSARRVEQ